MAFSPEHVGALILAAGKGTRMHSSKPKVLAALLEEPMLRYGLAALEPFFGERIWCLVGHEAERVMAAFAGEERRFVVQHEQNGTGHALMVAWPELAAAGLEYVLVTNGDMPLLGAVEIEALLNAAAKADIGFLTLTLENPGAYGRVVRTDGAVTAIVEAKDYDEQRFGPMADEVNAGVYLLKLSSVGPLLDALTNENANGEYYITDLVGLAVAAGLVVEGVRLGNTPSLLGVNSPAELTVSEEVLRARLVDKWLNAGVTMHAPSLVRIGPRVRLEPGAELFGPCELYGECHIARDARILSHTVLWDAEVGAGAQVRSFCHVERAIVGAGCSVGPFARLRPGALMEEGAAVGNFVEMKKARLGKGAKAGHLTYLGDADVGENVNIGAGTITCNYDGVNKHRTTIGDNAFIGSNTALVAPVSVGENALVGAGSVISKNVPDNSLGVTRAPQRNLPRRS